MNKTKAIVIGAGIVGLATARALALKGYSVLVIERSLKSVGASVRNFGMIWPIGQPSGSLYERAMRSRSIWKSISETGCLWVDPVGSLHVATQNDEWKVLQEIEEDFKRERSVRLLRPSQLAELSPATNQAQCMGGLYSSDEVIVNPASAISALPGFLYEKYGIEFIWGTAVREIQNGAVCCGNGTWYNADLIFVCSGSDFETLYPAEFLLAGMTKCKLQMMRFAAQPNQWRMGPALCGGLSLIHYKSFEAAHSLPLLRARFEMSMPDYIKYGIHVMAAQNDKGEITIGDSHEYGLNPEPFDKAYVDQCIIDYLQTFCIVKYPAKLESWHGVYAKSTNGGTEFFKMVDPGVYILNALGGAGMTLSFGLAEEVVGSL
jgi:FAD dependent oxidoreductase TIGR03364